MLVSGRLNNGRLQINGDVKQNGNTSHMIFRIPRLIEHVSSIMTLEVRVAQSQPIFGPV